MSFGLTISTKCAAVPPSRRAAWIVTPPATAESAPIRPRIPALWLALFLVAMTGPIWIPMAIGDDPPTRQEIRESVASIDETVRTS